MVKGKTQKWIDENESRFHLTPEETAFIHENMAKIGKASSQREKDILLAENTKYDSGKAAVDYRGKNENPRQNINAVQRKNTD